MSSFEGLTSPAYPETTAKEFVGTGQRRIDPVSGTKQSIMHNHPLVAQSDTNIQNIADLLYRLQSAITTLRGPWPEKESDNVDAPSNNTNLFDALRNGNRSMEEKLEKLNTLISILESELHG